MPLQAILLPTFTKIFKNMLNIAWLDNVAGIETTLAATILNFEDWF